MIYVETYMDEHYPNGFYESDLQYLDQWIDKHHDRWNTEDKNFYREMV
jgi:hypothetical protein